MNIRQRIEGLAAYYAAKNMTPEGLAELTHIVDLQDFYYDKGDAEQLRQVDEQTFYSKLGDLRGKVSDRAILRAMHFFGDDRRAVEMAQALRERDVEAYKAIMLASGASSMSRLENIYPAAMVEERSVASFASEGARPMMYTKHRWMMRTLCR